MTLTSDTSTNSKDTPKSSKKRGRLSDIEKSEVNQGDKDEYSRTDKSTDINTPTDLDSDDDDEPKLITDYELPKPDEWQSLSKYRSFILAGDKFNLGETVFVMPQIDCKGKNWVATVKDIRARDTSTVFLSVQWYYRPEELPGGRRVYHGHDELIKSNHDDIIPVGTCNGHAIVTHWKEADYLQEEIPRGYYWRQEIDTKTMKISKVATVCVCKKQYNPDKKMIWCPSCTEWFHMKCVENAANKRDRSNGVHIGQKRPFQGIHILRGGNCGIVGDLAKNAKRGRIDIEGFGNGKFKKRASQNSDVVQQKAILDDDSDDDSDDDFRKALEEDKVPDGIDLYCPRCDREI